MKSSLIVVATLLAMSVKAFAQPVAVPVSDIESYKQATLLALNALSLQCFLDSGIAPTGQTLSQRVTLANAVMIDDQGAQPLLIFITEAADKVVATVTTTNDYKSILSVSVEKFIMGQTNTGDLRHPSIHDDWVSTGKMTCK